MSAFTMLHEPPQDRRMNMFSDNKIWIANSGDNKIGIDLKMANRHGLIAGATGTGKPPP